MKVLHISTSDLDGGAARAAYRLHKGLQTAGVASSMLVQKRLSDDPHVLGPKGKLEMGWSSLRPTLDMLPLYLVGRADRQFSTAWSGDRRAERAKGLSYDVINLHWINKGFIQIESLARLPRPLIWTLHDMWPFSGGCHYDGGCGRYVERCGACPRLSSSRQNDLSRWVWRRKHRAWQELELTIVCPSRWLADCARRSALLGERRVEVIPYGLDLGRFRPRERWQARDWLGLPMHKRLVLFSAVKARQNIHKGYQVFRQALQELADAGWGEKLEAVVLGASAPEGAPDLPLKAHYLGYLQDEVAMALVYAAADVFVLASQQDNLPNTLLESLACGTPCVAFEVGGVPEAVEHQATGFLAQAGDAHGLAQGVEWVLEDDERWQMLCQASREKAEGEFDQAKQAGRYLSLYEELVEASRGGEVG